ncbi:MAG: GDSL-type esterase/lipase family protein [Acidaminococcales bacterium]|jgi:lysophospholipase L1-like esterase|nr:GDSL-type esterase/lipase family protein [Acidaminococcales bacterium]
MLPGCAKSEPAAAPPGTPGEYAVYMPYYKDKVSLFEFMAQNTEKRKNTVVFLGDSLTDFAEWPELLTGKRANIVNRGIAGDTAYGVLNRLDNIVALQPASIFLLIGINDLCVYAQPQATQKQYEQIVAILRTKLPRCKLYLQTLLPINNYLLKVSINNEVVAAFNERIRNMANAADNITVIDLYPLFLKDGQLDLSYTNDGIHLNANGYQVWLNAVKNKV